MESEEDEDDAPVTPSARAAAGAGLDARVLSNMEERDFAHVTEAGADKTQQYLSVRCAPMPPLRCWGSFSFKRVAWKNRGTVRSLFSLRMELFVKRSLSAPTLAPTSLLLAVSSASRQCFQRTPMSSTVAHETLTTNPEP